MRLISSVSWVKKGASQTPQKVALEKEEMKGLFAELGSGGGKDEDDQEQEEDTDLSKGDESIERKYDLDKYDEEDDNLRLEPLNSLACFATNQDDALLTRKDDGDDSDQEDMAIEPTDNLVVCGTINGDDSSLDVYVYNEENAQFYIHHDVFLSSMPVCLEWLNFSPTSSDSPVNLIAVGSLNPWIEIWDLNMMESLEADFVLGDVNVKKKLKKLKKIQNADEKKQARRKIRGHTDSVVCLSSNQFDGSELASGSADKTVLVWDLNTMRSKQKAIKCHKDRVQSVKYHPKEAFTLLSGSADQTVVVHDCRDRETRSVWSCFEAEIEKVAWDWNQLDFFLCSDDSGNVHVVDRRVEGKVVKSVRVHDDDSSPAVFALSSLVPGLLVTASEESDVVKVWDLNGSSSALELVAEKKFKLGSINCVESSPDSGFVFAFGGSKSTSPLIWDLREMEEVRAKFYPRMGIQELQEEKEEAQHKKNQIDKRRARALKFKELQAQRGQNSFNSANYKDKSSSFNNKRSKN